ncbi:hypothetical protein F5882DRAFT_373424 [Hyaloscypha sp. PMI_1271]|nr:hypothetical protein F5882DRAFT_373424 [Hyaloscypha sp. PMI_1271]
MVMRHAKAADIDKTHQQLSYVYNNLDAEFRMQINAPDEKTVASEWLKGLALKQESTYRPLPAPKPRHLLTAAWGEEKGDPAKDKRTHFEDKPYRRDYDGQRFRRYRRPQSANFASDFVDVPEEEEKQNVEEAATRTGNEEEIIEATMRDVGTQGDDVNFTYMRLLLKAISESDPKSCCVDTGCSRPMSRLGKIWVIAWVIEHLEPGLLLGNEFLWAIACLIDYETSTLTFGCCGGLAANVEVLARTLKVVRRIRAARKVIIPPKSRAIVPIEYAPVPENSVYFFEGIYAGAENTILDHVNFVSILNDTDVAKTIFAETKLSTLSNAQDHAFYTKRGQSDSEEAPQEET